jgi:hypothetical protein
VDHTVWRRCQVRMNRRHMMTDIAHIGAGGSRVGRVIRRDEHAAERFGIAPGPGRAGSRWQKASRRGYWQTQPWLHSVKRK